MLTVLFRYQTLDVSSQWRKPKESITMFKTQCDNKKTKIVAITIMSRSYREFSVNIQNFIKSDQVCVVKVRERNIFLGNFRCQFVAVAH